MMKATEMETWVAAPMLLNAFRKGPEEFGAAATVYASGRRMAALDAGGQECVELLDYLVDRLSRSDRSECEGLEEACVFLLEHLAERFQEENRVRRQLSGMQYLPEREPAIH